MADINDIVDRQREQLAARDKALLDQISADYQKVIDRIKVDLGRLQARIQAAQTAGVDFSPSWLFRSDRYVDLLSQAQREMQRFSALATAQTAKEQLVQVRMAERHVFEMETAQIGDVSLGRIGQTFNRLPTRAVEGIVGRASDGSPLKGLFDSLGPDLGATLRDELIQAVATGQGPRVTAGRIRDLVNYNEARAQLIARTETIQAYREGAHVTSLENADVLDGWVWVTALDGRACAACIALNGSFHQLEERMACHPACRCTKRFDTKSWAELGIKGIGETRPPPLEPGAQWFKGVSRETQALILGKKAAQAYADGDVDLHYFVGLREDPRWGRSYFQRAFKDAILGPQPGVKISYTPLILPPIIPPILPPPPPPLPPPPEVKVKKPRAPRKPKAPAVEAPPFVERTAAEARAELERAMAKYETDLAALHKEERVITGAMNPFRQKYPVMSEREAVPAFAELRRRMTVVENQISAHLNKRGAIARDILRVKDPIKVKAVFQGSFDNAPAAVKIKIKEGIEFFRNYVSENVGSVTDRDRRLEVNVLTPQNSIMKNRSYQVGRGIYMGENAPHHTVVHEAGHWIELWSKTGQVRKAVAEFYERRTAGETFKRLIDVDPRNFEPDELTKVDKWIDKYMGKWYATGHNSPDGTQNASEVISMGLEYFHKAPLEFARKDPGYFDFIYNVVRGIK
jgi:SPP1 gp7 family putative phage head morphogenesis protein